MARKKANNRMLVILLALIAVVCIALWYADKVEREGKAAAAAEQPADEAAEAAAATLAGEGAEAPDFTVEMIDGSKVALSELRGKVVLLNFWATWCTPCVNELPHFQKIYDELSDKIELVAIHSELITDDVQEYLDGQGYTMPFALDSDGSVIASLGGSTMLPMTVVVDAEGRIVYNKVGSITYELLKSLIEPLID